MQRFVAVVHFVYLFVFFNTRQLLHKNYYYDIWIAQKNSYFMDIVVFILWQFS